MPKVNVYITRTRLIREASAAPANGNGHAKTNGHSPPDQDAELMAVATRAAKEMSRVAGLADIPGIREAHEKHKADATRGAIVTVPAGKPAPDFLADYRALAKVLGFLGHDSPERGSLLQAAGLDAGALSPRQCVTLGRSFLEEMDRRHASEVCQMPWENMDNPDRDRVPPVRGVNARRLSEVEEREVEWLWRQRVPVGYLTLVSGDPDLGKTWLLLDLFARVTTGRPLPDGTANPFGDRRDVLWVSAEDADADVVLPRFRKLGGDPSRLHSLAFVRHREYDRASKAYKEREQSLDLSRHLDHLDDWLGRHPLVVAVGLDPLAAFVGATDTHRNSDVRRLLTPLGQLADRRRVALVGNNHLHKGDGDNAMYRGMGSIAFVAHARSSWLVSRDPKAPKDRRLLTPIKKNIATEDVGGLAFRVGPAWAGISWEEGTLETTADEALRGPERETKAPARAEAKEWLRELLKDGPRPARDCLGKAKADGLCRATLLAAKKDLGVRTDKTGGTGEGWVWSLPTKGA